MELEKLKKDYHQKEAQFEEVKIDRDRLSKEINQNVQDKEKAESAKRSYEVCLRNDLVWSYTWRA